MNLPQARTADLLEQEADKELLIYDLRIDKAYNLNETLKNVYKACNGKSSFDDLKQKHKFTDDLIHFALGELQANNLLENYQSDYFAQMNRREVVRKVGLATVAALPVIVGLTVPKAANAASRCDTTETCSEFTPCAAPCTSCTGTFLCGGTNTSCPNSGAACASSGTCLGVNPPFTPGRCSNYTFMLSCFSNSDCSVNDICRGSGTCT